VKPLNPTSPVEQWPLAAKPMLGCERVFVFGQESRYRLP